MSAVTYQQRRGQLEAYFDRTAFQAWSRLTSDAPVGRIRATVRAGRNTMRQTLLDWLPEDLHGKRLLDAGCGTGALAVEAARRGAHVVAVDLSSTLIELARTRAPRDLAGAVEFRVGDMRSAGSNAGDCGRFDHVVAMDSLIHYPAGEIVGVLAELAAIADRSILFTFAPSTAALATMHAVGRLFPRADRAPAIEPVGAAAIIRMLATHPAISAWTLDRSERVASGFYISQAMELRREASVP